MNLEELMALSQTRVEKLFTHYLKAPPCQAPMLQAAMAYSVMNGGKRIRPLLIYATGYALNADWENLDVPACAIELIHAYSLIHDDLPAMDNADLRRGQPSCHKAYNEALAILAGDALQPLAFEILAAHPASLTAEQRLSMIATLSKASGYDGIAAGQALDLAGTDSPLAMYQLKTGSLLTACVRLGALAAKATPPDLFIALENYAKDIGLAFQIQDDLLDLEHSETTGKPQGLDLINDKLTYPMQIGVEKARERIEELFASALSQLAVLGKKADILRAFAGYLMQRRM